MPHLLQTKHEWIHSDLKAKIARGIYRPGQTLPSQSELMEEYDVAQGTIRQALVQLQADGFVTSHRGRGTFVCDLSAPTAPPNVAASATIGLVIITTDENDHIVTDQLITLQKAVANLSYELAVRAFQPSDEDAAFEWALRHQGTVVWGAATRRLVDRLSARNHPTVLFGELLDGECPSGVGWVHDDVEALLDTALQLMVAMGHRQLWFVNRSSSGYFRHLSEVFHRNAKTIGIGGTVREVLLETPEDEPAILEHLAAAGDNVPTALLIEGDIRACRLIHLLQGANWSVPERIGVVALGAAEVHRLGVSELYRVITPLNIGVVRAAETLAEMIDTGHVVRHTLAPRLAVGKTCGPVRVSNSSRDG